MFSLLACLHPIRGRRFISATMLVIVLGSGLVFSIPLKIVKDRSIPFPCMDCNCSCRDAESCWSGCNCMLPAQKLAWAEANGVQPPEWFQRFASQAPQGNTKSSAACCSTTKTTRACCNSRAVKVAPQSAQSRACASVACQEDSVITLVTTIGKRRCHGIDRLYVLFSLVLPVDRQSSPVIPTPTDWLGPVRSVTYRCTEMSDLNRPPERASV